MKWREGGGHHCTSDEWIHIDAVYFVNMNMCFRWEDMLTQTWNLGHVACDCR
jgi:hypothetical protein